MKIKLIIILSLSFLMFGCDARPNYYVYKLDCKDREVEVLSAHFDDPYDGSLYSYRINGIQKSVNKIDCSRKRTKQKMSITPYEKMKEE